MVRKRTVLAILGFGLYLASRAVEASLGWEDDTDTELLELSWGQWLTSVISKSVYAFLIFSITICIIITSYKNKSGTSEGGVVLLGDGETMGEVEDGGWIDTIWKAASGGTTPALLTSTKGPQQTFRKLLYRKADDPTADAETRLRDKLRDAEAAVTVLKQELEKSNKARMELENTLDSIDRDKETAEGKLECHKVKGALELEQLKREIDSTRRKLQTALKERDDLSKEVLSLQRDARIVSSALRDNQLMDIRLEEARREIDALKNQLANIQKEKETAVQVVQEIMKTKNHTPRCGDFSSISTTIGSSLEQDAGRKNFLQTDLVKGFVEEIRRTFAEGESMKLCLLNDQLTNLGPDANLGDGINVQSENDLNADSQESTFSDAVKTKMTDSGEEIWRLEGEEEEEGPGLVTGSQAFRRFLESNFHEHT